MLRRKHRKYITFLAPTKKDVPDVDNGKKKKTITYKLKFFDSYRFLQCRLPDLVGNLSEINKKECLECMKRKKIKSEFGFIGFKNDRLHYKCEEVEKDILSQ